MANSAFSPPALGNGAVTGANTASGNWAFGKNAIINGAFDIWQRGTSFAAMASAAYCADRWRYLESGDAVHTVSRSTDVPTVAEAGVLANYSLLVDCTTVDAAIGAGDYIGIAQPVEGYVWRQFAQRALTLSFWVKATKTGTYCVALRNNGAGVPDRSFIAEYTVSVADTWEKKTINITASPSAGTWNYTTSNGLDLWFVLAGGSTYQTTAGSWNTGNYLCTSNQGNACDDTANNFRLALVQLEVGDVATDFEIRPFPTELAMCQRYYEKTYNYDTAPGTASSVGALWNYQTALTNTGRAIGLHWSFAVPKRATPTMTWYSVSDGASGNVHDYITATNIAMSDINIGMSGAGCFGTQGAATAFQLTGQAVASAEL